MSTGGQVPQRFGDGRFEPMIPLATREVSGVFLARDTARGDLCALKLLDASRVPPEAGQRFLAEARVLERIDHPHVVRGRGHGDEGGLLWYAMDHLPGGSLRDIAARTRVPPEHALALAFQVLLGLGALHGAGVVHRDVKLTNVLLDADLRVRLADLGIAHHPDGTVSFKTMAGQELGTPGYRPPEQVEDAAACDARADVFATGVLMYRLLTRRPPHRLHLAHLRPEVIDEVHPAIRAILLVATHPDPERRYADAHAMARAVAVAHDALVGLDDAPVWLARLDDPHGPDPWDAARRWIGGLLDGP